ncbi:MAG: zf-HC2 domain-containing protein [Acidimicrobiales bacterium]
MIDRHRWQLASGRLGCREVGRMLQFYLDGEIDELAARRIAQHLDDCRRCGLEAVTYTEVKRALRRRGDLVDDGSVERLRTFAARLARGEVEAGDTDSGTSTGT